MKSFKSKIISLVLCLCMCLSFFTGCSIFVKNEKLPAGATTIKIGDSVITKQELINAYYSFYQQNSYYFAYSSEEDIMKVFYDSVVAREIILVEATKLIEDGTLKFSQKALDDIWYDTIDFLYSQIDSKEKALLLLQNSDEEKLPERLQGEDEDAEKAIKYEPYKFEKITQKDYSEVVTGDKIVWNDAIAKFEADLYFYNDSKDEDNRTHIAIDESEHAKRLEAYNMFLSELILSAKANKKDSSKNAVLLAELKRVYESYYESELYTMYQEYINSGAGDKIDDAAIVKKYKELLNASTESNTNKDNYIKIISANDNDTLILYHYGDTYKYFTVQHVLIKYDDKTLDFLKGVPGYDTSKDLMFRKYYEEVRKLYAVEDKMTTSYRGEDGFTVKVEKDGELVKDQISVTEIRQNYDTEIAKRLATLRASDEYINANASKKELMEVRARTLLFNEFAWKYSGDTGSLTNDKLSGVLGFTISSEAENHGTLVKDFANGARELFEEYMSNDSINIGDTIKGVVSDYGIHLMMLTGVYEAGEVVSSTKVDGTDKTDAEIIEELKNTYVSNLTEQTLYEYMYDLLKEQLIGDSGTYFADFRNELVKKYKEQNKIVYVNKLSFKELNEAIG